MTKNTPRQRQIEAKRFEGGVHSKTMDEDRESICCSRSKLFVTYLNAGLIICLLLIFCSCARNTEDPLVAQMRLRKMQTRTFVGASSKAVAKELLAILQDEGFMVKNVNAELGLITAERDSNIEKFASKFWAYVFSGKQATWKKHSLVEITSNITEEKGNTKVRINLLLRVFDNLGRIVDVEQVLEEEVYIDFFNKVQRGLISGRGA